METKIPISCISNINNDNKKYINLIKCSYCNGIFYEPIYLKVDHCIICKNCFYNKCRINKDAIKKNELDKLYEKIDNKIYESLFKFKYFCPLCKLNNSNEKKEYQYDTLINHLKICNNQIIFKDLCRCTNILKIYLKDLFLKKNELDLINDNKILEKEIEKEKLTLNNKQLKIFLDNEEKKEKANYLNEIQKKHIKKKFIGKKRNIDKKKN